MLTNDMAAEALWGAIWTHRDSDPAASLTALRAFFDTPNWRSVETAGNLANLATEFGDYGLARRYLDGMLALAPDLPPLGDDIPWPPVVDARVTPPEAAAGLLSAWGVVLVRRVFDLGQLQPIVDLWSRRLAADDPAARLLPLAEALPPGVSLDAGFIPAYLRAAAAPFLPTGTPRIWGGYVRAVHPGFPTGLHWHQDITAFCRYSVNLWAPFTPCGGDAPGLECVAQRLKRVFTDGANENPDQWGVDDAVAAAWAPPERLFAPEMSAGDALLFFGATLHRSQVTPAMTKMRVSLELRME